LGSKQWRLDSIGVSADNMTQKKTPRSQHGSVLIPKMFTEAVFPAENSIKASTLWRHDSKGRIDESSARVEVTQPTFDTDFLHSHAMLRRRINV
jgi:hypothetical protein